MKNSRYLLVIIILAVVIVATLHTTRKKGSDNKAGEESAAQEKMAQEVHNTDKQNYIFEYLKENISQLSPKKEVLGGSFYITSVDFTESNALIVDYEDGHITLTAELIYQYTDSDNFKISSFNIIKQ